MCICLCVHLLTFPCLAHGSSVSATLTLVVHPKCPHFTTLGQNTCMGLTHCNLSYKVTFQICHLACGEESRDYDEGEKHGSQQRNIYRQINVYSEKVFNLSLTKQ